MRARWWPLTAALIIVLLACRAWIIVPGRNMYGPMTCASAWMMTPHWELPYLLLVWVVWAVMMTAMMLPSATPMIVLVGGGRGYFVTRGHV
jgi:predicted metal-binding membrane protein